MRTIYKYEIPRTGTICEIELPLGYQIIHAGPQGDRIFIWALVDSEARKATEKFRIFGTGWDLPFDETLHFIKTIQLPNGLVWHLFMVPCELEEIKWEK